MSEKIHQDLTGCSRDIKCQNRHKIKQNTKKMEIKNRNHNFNQIFTTINKSLNLACVNMSGKFDQDPPIRSRDIA